MSVLVNLTVTPQWGGRSGGDAAVSGVWAIHRGHRRSHGIGCHLGRSPARAEGQKVSKKKPQQWWWTTRISLCFPLIFLNMASKWFMSWKFITSVDFEQTRPTFFSNSLSLAIVEPDVSLTYGGSTHTYPSSLARLKVLVFVFFCGLGDVRCSASLSCSKKKTLLMASLIIYSLVTTLFRLCV